MLMGRIVGTVVSTQKDEGMVGYKLLVVQNLDLSLKPTNSYLVAIDAVGAGMGEVVIVVQGSSARLTAQTKNRPVDAAIICIVDSIEINGRLVFEKSKESPKPELEMVTTRRAG